MNRDSIFINYVPSDDDVHVKNVQTVISQFMEEFFITDLDEVLNIDNGKKIVKMLYDKYYNNLPMFDSAILFVKISKFLVVPKFYQFIEAKYINDYLILNGHIECDSLYYFKLVSDKMLKE